MRDAGTPAPEPDKLRVTVVSDGAGFASLEPRWNRLFELAAEPTPFSSFQWLYTWWRSYRGDLTPHIVLVENDSAELVGIAPLMWNSVVSFGMRLRCLEFIGDGTHETDHIHFLVHRDHAAAAIDRILDTLHGTKGWNLVRLNQMPRTSLTAQRVLSWTRRHRLLCSETPVLCLSRRLPADYETLLGDLQSRFRSKLRSTRRKLAEKYAVEFGTHDAPEEFDAALDALFRNHGSRWHAKGEQGVFASPERRTFYHQLTPAFRAKGYLRFYYLKLDGAIVAQQYCFRHQGVVYLLQEGFDYARAKENVGNVLRCLVFERLIEEGESIYDFLAGDSQNKRIWSDTTDFDLRLSATRRSPKGYLSHYTPILAETIKNLIKRVLPPKVVRFLTRLRGSSTPGPGQPGTAGSR